MNQKISLSNHLPLPLAIEEITPQWLTAALAIRFPGVTVEKAEIVDLIRGTCTKIRLRLQMDEAGRRAGIPESVILKGGFEPHSREMYVTHEKEVQAYRDVFPALKLQSPTCYFADFDLESRQGIVIIEDLTTRGVEFCHPLVPQSYEAVARRLSALAKFHAASWDSPELQPGGKWDMAEDILPATCEYMSMYLAPGALDRFTTASQGAAASVRFHSAQWLADSLAKLPRWAAETPRCLIHGDTHLGNLYVEPDGTPGFFDPQILQGPSMAEVAYHVTGALDTADRGRWQGALIGHYLDELAANGVTPPSFDEATKQFGAFLIIGYFIFLVNESHFQPEAINTVYTARFNAAMLENNTEEILRALP